MSVTELKPCPFCGRIPIVDDCGDDRYFIRCKCGIKQDKLYWRMCDAIRKWNTRIEKKKGKWINPAAEDVYKCSVCEEYVGSTKVVSSLLPKLWHINGD